MSTLYKINQELYSCFDEETGEILNPERLDELFAERTQKIENIVLYVKNLNSDISAYEAEISAFEERKKKAKAKAEKLLNYLTSELNGQGFESTKCAVSFRRSEKVEVDNKELIPKEFLKEKVSVTYDPDKNAIKKAIKAGQIINGCRLIENLNPSIK